MLFATDLDRTLLPNGPAKTDHKLPELLKIIKDKKLTLAYVSGRNLKQLEEARVQFSIPLPDYFIAEVGTILYKNVNDKLERDTTWDELVAQKTPNWNWQELADLGESEGLKLQEAWRQNKFKASFYLYHPSKKHSILSNLARILEEKKIPAVVVYSFDPLIDAGLIDILPKEANKVSALEFLRKKLKFRHSGVVYCGDSGNDLLALSGGYKTILVKNAPDEVKQKAKADNQYNGSGKLLYIAKGGDFGNGNYASGILEGLHYFKII